MTLVVQAPATYEPERRYILGVVLADWLGLDWRLEIRERSDVRITLEGEPGGVVLPDALFATAADEWLKPASYPRLPLPRASVSASGSDAPIAGSLPILYGSPAPGSAVMVHDGESVHLGVDVFGGAFFMLTRYEEVAESERDRYGRFPASSSVAGRAGLLSVPIVDEYVEVLWSALERCWPRLERVARSFEVVLSHDVDDPLATWGRSRAGIVRQLGADMLVRRDVGLAARRVGSLAAPGPRGRRLDPHNTFDFLMDVSERHGRRSAFYFLANREPSARDGHYRIEDPWIRLLIARVHGRGHEVGLHASFDSYRDPTRTSDEFTRLRAVAERAGVRQEHWGGRQHYLRWANPTTWRNWDEAGLGYDSTLAYADAVGFRAGTCHAYRVFDLERRRPLALRERPFQAMDATLFSYMSLSTDAARNSVVELAAQCRRHRGSLGILWHKLRSAGEKRWYESLVAAITS